MDAKRHWERVYESKAPTEVSWFQREARISLELISHLGSTSEAVIDVGGGASTLVDGLLDRGYADIAVLDIAGCALDAARIRLGSLSARVKWITADVLHHAFPPREYDVWHDRAVFHFLTSVADRRTYVEQVARAVRPGGAVIVATFAEDGPSKCSGLDVCRYSPEGLHAELGPGFELRTNVIEEHVTPKGEIQRFQYCAWTVGAR